METINIFNYESYYLDYLEGNLTPQEEILLFNFLEKHPELVVDDEELPVLTDDLSESYSFSKKEALIAHDESDPISDASIDYFMIAHAEGILSAEKSQELLQAVQERDLDSDLAMYSSCILTPDNNEVFVHKSDLKQKRKIVLLWPIAASVAAIAILAIFIWLGSFSINTPPANTFSEGTEVETPIELEPVNKTTTVAQKSEEPISTNGLDAPELKKGRYEPKEDGSTNIVEEQPNNYTITPLKKRSSRVLISSVSADDLDIVSTHIIEKNKQQPPLPRDHAMGFAGMNNPIKPITTFIKKNTNTDIDFRSKKASQHERGGFYLKIGKFEFFRKRGRK